MAHFELNRRVVAMKPSATLAMASKARELEDKGVDVVVMSAGEPDFDTPSIIRDVAKRSLDAGKTHYVAVRGVKNMIAAMQAKFLRDQNVSYTADEVMCTVGGKAAILMALEALVNDGDEVILLAPYWVSYEEQIRLVGGVPVVIKCEANTGFFPTKAQLLAAITPKTKAILVNSPNNPTGGVISEEQLRDLAAVVVEHNLMLISDEIYEKLLYDGVKHISPASLSPHMKERCLVISGVAKGYAMTGFRVGVVAGPKFLVDAMVKLQSQQTTCLPEFIQDAAAYALKEDHAVAQEINMMLASYAERRAMAIPLFSSLPNVVIFKPHGAFYIWADFSYYVGKELRGAIIKDDIDFSLRMLDEAHVAAVPGTPFGAPGFVRFSIASAKKEIERAVAHLRSWLI